MAYRPSHQLTDLTTGLTSERLILFVVLSFVALAAAVALPVGVFQPLFIGAAVGLSWVVALAVGHGLIERLQGRFISKETQRRLATQPVPAVLTNANGVCLTGNDLSDGFRGWARGVHICEGLDSLVAEPKLMAARLSRAATLSGHASHRLRREESSGCEIRVYRVARRQLIWTLVEPHADDDLAMIRISSDKGISLNAAAEKLFGAKALALSDLIRDLPVRHMGRHAITSLTGDMSARVLELSATREATELAIIPLNDPSLSKQTETEKPHTNLLDAVPVPMLKIADDGTLLELNDQARDILSIEADEPLVPIFELVEGMGRPIMDWLVDATAGRGLLKPEIVRATVPGQELYLQITLSRSFEQGRAVLYGILNDATELKTLEAQFVQSQKMQAIGQLAGGVAHDFNNLLTAISGHCDLLLLHHDAGDPEYADLIQISQNANRAASLVGQLLAFSRKQNLKPQALDLRDTMLDLAHLLNRLIGEKLTLDVTHAPGPQMIRADRRQLEQVIVNLVVNARDAMPDGGKISVQTRSEFLSQEMIWDRARLMPGEYVVIEVSDTGVGIPTDVVSKIFEPFYTTKNPGEGTGLGLSTAYGIVKQTGGYIFVDSEPGEGTLFSLYFPASSETVSEPEAAAPSSEASTRRGDGVILLVEDEAPVRAFASRALRLRGYTVIEAEDAEVALLILEDKSLKFDMFVTDVIMPGMDGPTWVRQALKERPDTRVVFVSGYAEEGRAEKQARIPNSVFLPKPFSLQQLTALVQEQLELDGAP